MLVLVCINSITQFKVYVKKDHRQRGIFKSMFNEFLKYAKS